jgi:hypothetical protein
MPHGARPARGWPEYGITAQSPRPAFSAQDVPGRDGLAPDQHDRNDARPERPRPAPQPHAADQPRLLQAVTDPGAPALASGQAISPCANRTEASRREPSRDIRRLYRRAQREIPFPGDTHRTPWTIDACAHWLLLPGITRGYLAVVSPAATRPQRALYVCPVRGPAVTWPRPDRAGLHVQRTTRGARQSCRPR